jgi:glycosyltransferase involved in cell wall biosynthesis
MDAFSKTISSSEGRLPHVLVVSNHFEIQKQLPSAGTFVDSQIASLRRAGVEISTFDVGTTHAPFAIIHKWLELRKKVRRLKPDLIHGQYGTLIGLMATLAGRPAVLSFCGGDLLPGSPAPALRRRLGILFSNLAALRAHALICKSAELRQALWWRQSHAEVIPNGVDLACFTPGPQSEARKELGWDLQWPIVLFVSGGDPIRKGLKGLNVAEAALQVARVRVPDAELHVISHVKHTQMPLYYRAADVLLCASKREGSPNVVKEALACNLPVVSTPVGDVPERLAGVYPSALVPREPQAMGEALAHILLKRARSNGRAYVADLSLDHVAQRVLAVYRKALGTYDEPQRVGDALPLDTTA